jgi:hypothetical protein
MCRVSYLSPLAQNSKVKMILQYFYCRENYVIFSALYSIVLLVFNECCKLYLVPVVRQSAFVPTTWYYSIRTGSTVHCSKGKRHNHTDLTRAPFVRAKIRYGLFQVIQIGPSNWFPPQLELTNIDRTLYASARIVAEIDNPQSTSYRVQSCN